MNISPTIPNTNASNHKLNVKGFDISGTSLRFIIRNTVQCFPRKNTTISLLLFFFKELLFLALKSNSDTIILVIKYLDFFLHKEDFFLHWFKCYNVYSPYIMVSVEGPLMDWGHSVLFSKPSNHSVVILEKKEKKKNPARMKYQRWAPSYMIGKNNMWKMLWSLQMKKLWDEIGLSQ